MEHNIDDIEDNLDRQTRDGDRIESGEQAVTFGSGPGEESDIERPYSDVSGSSCKGTRELCEAPRILKMNNSVCVFNSTVDNINVNIRSRSTDPSSNTPIKIHVGEGGHVQHFNTTTVIQPDEPQLLTEQELIRCRNQLRQYYKSNCKIRLLPWMTRDPRNRLEMKNLFISLYLICEVPNAIEVSVQVQHYKEVLPSSSPYRALIRGKAGAGKTTLLEKLALDWAEEKLPHTHNENPLLFLIRMKSVVKGDTLINAIFKQRLLGIEIERMFKTKLSNYIDNNSDKVIILVDAVDEYGGEYGTDEPGEIENIIRNKYLSEACVIATTRPWRAFQIIDKSPDVYIGQNYEVKGYTQVQVKEYVEQFFGSKVEMANTLLNQMNMTGISTGIATIPVMCMLICILYRDHKAVLPDTISDLYELLYEYLMQCNRKDNLEQVSERDKVETVDKLAKLAFYGLRNKQMCFEEGEYIDANVLRNACKMGLLLQINLTTESEDQTSFPAGLSSLPLIKNYYEFFHKTFQEWFAARYLASKEINSLNQICEQTIPDIQTCLDFELPLRFLSGSKVPVVSEVPTKCLLRIVQNTQDLSDFNDNKLDLPKTKEFQEFLELLVKCNMESKSKGRFNHLLNDVFEKCNAHFTNATSMTLHALAYMLKFGGALNGCPHCGKPSSDFCPHQLRILDFKIGCYSADTNSDIDILWGEFEAVGKQYYKRCQLLSNEPEEKLQAIFEQVKNMLPQGIPHLSLARTLAFSKLCKFMETWKGDYIFMEKVIQNIPFTRITNFTINGVNLSNNCELLCKNLTTMTSLRKVDLGCTSLEVQHCSFIGKMVESLHELRTLNLPKNKLQEIGEIVEQLHCVPNLTRLDLETTHLTSNSMSLLGKNLKWVPKLERLYVRTNLLLQDAVDDFVDGLQSISNLGRLNITFDFHLPYEKVTKCIQCLNRFENLQLLFIDGLFSPIIDSVFNAIATNLLPNLSNLRSLRLQGRLGLAAEDAKKHEVTKTTADILASTLKFLPSLIVLRLTYLWIAKEGLEAIQRQVCLRKQKNSSFRFELYPDYDAEDSPYVPQSVIISLTGHQKS